MNPKWTLVTGACSDIGLETIKLLLKKNELVWGIYKSNYSKLESLKKQYKKNLFLTKYDFLELEELNSYINEIKKFRHSIKSFISLASLRNTVDYGEISISDLMEHYTVNTIPLVLTIQELGNTMSDNGYGRIVIGSSIGIKFGGSNNSFCYSLTKLASEILPNISKNWVASNVLSNVVRIGVTNTSSMRSEDLSLRSNLIPIKRPANPIEIASFIVWLGSNENTYISHQIIPISGGE